MALKLRYHDAKLHAAQRPASEAATAIYDAVEQARCEALGMRRMAGVTGNLDALMEERYRTRGLSKAASKEEAPLSEALRVLVREAMVDAPAPAAARHVADLWRSSLDAEILRDLSALAAAAEDQRAFAKGVRRMLAHLDLDALPDDEARTARKATRRPRSRPARRCSRPVPEPSKT